MMDRAADRPVATLEAELRILALTELDASTLNRRRYADPKKLEELTESVREHGVLTPLLVRPAGDRFEVAAGHRRLEAARRAGLVGVPVIVREMPDAIFLEVLTIENLQREDVHPLDEADGYRLLMEKNGYDVETIAAKVGKSPSYVYQRLKLAELVPAVQKAFLADDLTAGHAILLARLRPEEQQKALKWLERDRRDDEVPGVRGLTAFIREHVLVDLSCAPFDTADATLLPKAGACGPCPLRAGNQALLFPEVKKGDTCTAPTCYQAKVAAHVQRIAEELQAKTKKKAALVSVEYSPGYGEQRAKGVIYRGGWREVRADGCPHARPAVIATEPYHSGGRTLGATLHVCTDPKCQKGAVQQRSSSSSPSSSSDAAYRKEREAQKEKDRQARVKETAQARCREAVLDAILAKRKDGLASLELTSLAAMIFESRFGEEDLLIARRHGWLLDPKKRKKGIQYRGDSVDDEIADAAIARMDAAAASALLVELLVAEEVIGRDRWRPSGKKQPPLLLTLAKAHRVDADAIMKRAAAEPACEHCGCVEARACPGGCAWDGGFLAEKRHVCTTPACLTAARKKGKKKAKAKPVQTSAKAKRKGGTKK